MRRALGVGLAAGSGWAAIAEAELDYATANPVAYVGDNASVLEKKACDFAKWACESDRTRQIARADLKAALVADPLLRYFLEQTVVVGTTNQDGFVTVNKNKKSGLSWVDNIYLALGESF